MRIWILQKRLHISWLLTCASAGIIVGMIVASSFLNVGYEMIALTIAFPSLLIGLYIARIWVLPIVIIAGGMVGYWRGVIELKSYLPTSFMGHTVIVRGTVMSDPSVKDKLTNVEVKRPKIDNKVYGGKIWASTASKEVIRRGDYVEIKGKLLKGFGNVSASIFNAQIVHIKPLSKNDPIITVRDEFSNATRRAIPDPQADLGIGYLTGQKTELSPEFSEALKNVGLTHIVVASGYNLTILIRISRRIFIKVSKYTALLAGMVMMLGFTLITGLSPSMIRAAIVTGLSLVAWYYGRKFHPVVLLLIVAALTVLYDPSYCWGDLGWQLSFTAFAGVMILAPMLQQFFFGDKKPNTIRQIVGETISAELVTLPIILLAFGQVSNISIVANLLILPFVPLAMLLTFGAGIITLFAPSIAMVVGAPATWLLDYMIKCVNYLSTLPGIKTALTVNIWMVVIYYVLLVVCSIYVWHKIKYNPRDASLVD